MSSPTYKGSCFCGAVAIEVTGAPAAMGLCHCASCRHWSASPVNAFTLWPPDAVKVVAGADQLGAYNKTDRSERTFCRQCGGHIMTKHPGWQLVDVYAAIIPDFAFEPQVHVNCAEAQLEIPDGRPHFKDLPKEMGGSGETVSW